MTIVDELHRARHLALAADETAARDLLLSLMPRIEQADRDDLMLEVFAQLGGIYLTRSANDGVAESIRRIRDCLGIYTAIAAGQRPDLVAQVTLSQPQIEHMMCRYTRRALFLESGLAAAHGDHETAADRLQALIEVEAPIPELDAEHAELITHARILAALALCDDDLYARSVPLWDDVLAAIDGPGDGGETGDHLFVIGATGYGRFCVETGALAEAEPWLRRAGARAEARRWQLAIARTKLERATAAWSTGQLEDTQRLLTEAYPAIAAAARAHDVSRSWLYFGLIRMAVGAIPEADQCWEHAERHWRELGKPLHIHRILLQRSWIAIFGGRFADAVELVAQAREWLNFSPRHSWLQYARLDHHLGSIWRAEALPDVGGPQHRRAMAKLEQAAELKVPAALAVDSVRYSIADPAARMRWAACVSAPLLAGAFAVAWEWENAELISELIEYHSARGAFTAQPQPRKADDWGDTATAAAPVEGEFALVASAPTSGARGLTRLGPLPPLRMDPESAPIMAHYRHLALQRYGRDITAAEPEWSTWPSD